MPPGRIELTDFKGLVTAPGQLERNPASCVQAQNFEFPAPGLIRKRRGFSRLAGNVGGPAWKLFTSQLLESNLLIHMGTSTAPTTLRHGDGTVAPTGLTTVDASNVTRADLAIRAQMALCQRNHYVTSDEGPRRVESDMPAGLVRYAGMPRGYSRLSVIVAAGTVNPLADGFARSYRITWHRKDADGIELGGAPTGRWTISNRTGTSGYTGAARRTSMSIQLPKEWGTLTTDITSDYYWRLWATQTFDEVGGQLGTDEMFLVNEAYVTGTDIANGYVLFQDDTPDSFLLSSPTLHTNLYNYPPGEAGILQGVANEDAPPPLADDVAYWQDCMWWASVTPRVNLGVNLIANLANNDTIDIYSNGTLTTFTGKTGALGAATDFSIVTTGTTSAYNIRETVANLVACINLNCATLGIDAYAVSTSGTNPGLIYLESRIASNGIYFTSSNLTAWQGVDGYDPYAAVESFDTAQPNGLWWSKPVRADAVPPANRLTVGPRDATILRVFPYRDRLLVFTDYGIFQVTGRTFADFSVFPFDLGFRLLARDCVVLCNERVYAWCHEGIVEIDDGGVSVISTPIENTIENAMVACGTFIGGGDPLVTGRDAFAQQSYAVAYRNQHQVRFFYPEGLDAAVKGCAFWFSFDVRTRCWSTGRWGKTFAGYADARACGVVRLEDDLLLHGSWSAGADTYLFEERRAYASTDYEDTARDGTADPIDSRLRIQFMVPDAGGAQHWQQTVWNWDADSESSSWVAIPTAVNVTFADEDGNATSTALTPQAPLTRSDVTGARRSSRLRVGLIHSTAEYCGITGVVQHYRAGSKFGRRDESSP